MPDRSPVKPLKCTACGAALELREGRGVCSYCGTIHLIDHGAISGIITRAGDEHAKAGIEAYHKRDFGRAALELELAARARVTQYRLTDIFTIRGNALMELGEQDKAIQAYRSALDLDPQYYKAWVGMGISYRKQGRLKDTEQCYARALEIESDYAELHASLGALYVFQGKVEQAVAELEKAIALDPSLAVGHGNYALALAQAGRFDEAEAALRQAVVLGYREHQVIRERIAALRSLDTAR